MVRCRRRGNREFIDAMDPGPSPALEEVHAEPIGSPHHSGLILPSTITFFHFSYSPLVLAVASSTDVPRGSTPIFARAAFISGCSSAFLISLLSRATIAGGVPAGA